MTELISSRQLRRTGDGSRSVERAAATGAVHRLRPGAYVDPPSWADLSETDRHLLRVRATADAYRTRPVFSHLSAAAIWDLPVLGARPEEADVSFDAPGGMTRRGVRCHRARWADGDVVERDGLLVTSPARTAFDLASTAPLARAVICIDALIRDGGVDRTSVVERVAQARPFPGVRRCDAALRAATGLAESPLESLSMARFVEHSIPLPRQQVEFRAHSGATYFADFHWPALDIIGEADGRTKYDSREDLIREKVREDDLRELVRGVVRWGWGDAWSARPLLTRLARAGVVPR